jgi:hypothetical protein
MSASAFVNDPLRDAITAELITLEQRIHATRRRILVRVEHGGSLETAETKRLLRVLREALAARAVMRDLQRAAAEEDLAESRR